MDKVEKFEDLKVWQDSIKLAREIYIQFTDSHDFGFRDQIQRSAVSIPSNIAEGFERQTNKEFIHFLFIAKGSCGELRTQLYLATDLNLIETEKGSELCQLTKEVSAMLFGLIKTRKQKFK